MTYEFDKHTPSEGTIAAQADAVAKPAGDVESFTGDVTSAHNKSKSTVEGALLTAMADADAPTKKQARDLVQGITVATAAIRNYATAVGDHNATVDNLNSQIRQEPTPEKKKKKHTALTGKFTTSEETLTDTGRASGRQLNDPLNPEHVKDLYTAGAMPSTTPALFKNVVTLDGKSQYQHYKAKIDNGDMPPFDKLSEDERRKFVKDNPDLVDYLMELPKPDKAEKEAVYDLVLPHLDGEDGNRNGDTVLDALDEDATPEEFAKAFGPLGAYGAYAKWAQKHGGPALHGDQQDYLKNFMGKTAPKFEDIKDYIADDEHRVQDGTSTVSLPKYGGTHETPIYKTLDGFTDEEQDKLLKQYGNGLLTLSDKDLGGGWDELPEEVRDAATEKAMYTRAGMNSPSNMDENENFEELADLLRHGDIQAGDGLSKELALTTADTLEEYDNSEYSWEKEGLGGDMLELVGRNHEATTEILSGDDMPEDYDNREFLKTVYDHEWEDDGKDAAKLTDWIGPASQDPGESALADKAYNSMMKGLTSTGDDGIFKDMMGDGGDSVGQVNPDLVESMMKNTRYHLDDLALDPEEEGTSPLDDSERVRMMMLIASDGDSAEDMSAAVAAHHYDNVNAWINNTEGGPEGPNEVAGQNARLQGYLDAGAYNEALERTEDADKAIEARNHVTRAGLGVVGAMTGPGGGATSSILNELIQEGNPPPSESYIEPSWDKGGGHLEVQTNGYMVDVLVNSGKIDPADLPEELRDPSGVSDDVLLDRLNETLSGENGALKEPVGEVGTYNSRLGGTYRDILNNWVPSSDDELEDLMDHGSPPGPG